LEEVLADSPQLRQRMNRYVVVQGLRVAQLAACNRLHEIEQRLARWLLMTQDRIGADSIPITHDFLAQMLGSGRPSVTVAAGLLQRAGVIEYTRGAVKILNRGALESAACECYDAIRRINHAGKG
jgi:CRP-like cAMP-binding protein